MYTYSGDNFFFISNTELVFLGNLKIHNHKKLLQNM